VIAAPVTAPANGNGTKPAEKGAEPIKKMPTPKSGSLAPITPITPLAPTAPATVLTPAGTRATETDTKSPF